MPEHEWIDGGVTAPDGFYASGVRCGLKEHGRDLGLLASPAGCIAAGMFTTNSLPGWPVVLDKDILGRDGRVAGVVANSGVANVATGAEGLDLAKGMSARAAAVIAARWGTEERPALVAQTGLIGEVPDAEKITRGIIEADLALDSDGGADFAEAIMTTDTVPKSRAVRIDLDGGAVTIGGAAKGAGMIAPNMATMLAFITTDAALSADAARALLRPAVDGSFNRISIDGDTSTSDMCLLLASGESDVTIDAEGASAQAFASALTALCQALAVDLVRDAEGVTRVCRVEITGAASDGDAVLAARSVAESPLVKSALFGGDPNWGRIWMAIGKSGAATDPERISIHVGQVPVLEAGSPTRDGKRLAVGPMSADEVAMTVDLGLGDGRAHYWFSDLSYDYVKINAEYHT
jgi:glutamate N-acetyltransferase/amino-acid N-acetyltransferase